MPVRVAVFQCPVLQKVRLSGGAPGTVPENVAQLAQNRKEHIKEQLEGLTRNLRQIEKHLATCSEKESRSRKSRDKVREQRTSIREEIAALDDEAASWPIRPEYAVLSLKRLDDS